MNTESILELLCENKTVTYDVECDLLDMFMLHLDAIQLRQGIESAMSLDHIASPTKMNAGLELTEFMQTFYRFDPPLVYWFALAPFRTSMVNLWDEHKQKHNAKVEKEYPPERWKGLYCCDQITRGRP